MVIHVYGVVRAGTAVPVARGVADAPVERVDAAGLAAVYSPVAAAAEPGDREAVLAHADVVAALHRSTDVVPVRFGATEPDTDRLRDVVRERADSLRAALTLVARSVEVAVRFSPRQPVRPSPETAPASAATSPGRAYLLERSQRDREARRMHEQLRALVEPAHADLARHARRATAVVCPDRGEVRGSYLVGWDALDDVTVRLGELADHPRVCLAWSGPLPPYSFVDEPSESKEEVGSGAGGS